MVERPSCIPHNVWSAALEKVGNGQIVMCVRYGDGLRPLGYKLTYNDAAGGYHILDLVSQENFYVARK